MVANTKGYRALCLEKFNEELLAVSFNSVCENLTKTGFFQVTGLSFVLIPVLNSMPALIFFMEKQLEKLEGDEQDKLWKSFLRALFMEYPQLAFNMALECDKSVYHKKDEDEDSGKNPAISPRIVIGEPTDFRHIASGSRDC